MKTVHSKKTILKINADSKPKLRGLKTTGKPLKAYMPEKSAKALRGGKLSQAVPAVAGNKARELKKIHDSLGAKIRQQTDEIKIKTGQLKVEVFRQQRSEEQIHIRTKAMELAADGIFIIDAQKPNFPIIYSNQSFQAMTGFLKRELWQRDYFSIFGPEADSLLMDELKRTIRQGRTFYGEMAHFLKNAGKYLVLLRLAPVRHINGLITHYVGIQTDITLMRQRELEIKEQREELLHVTRVGKMSEFVSALAHEISQPLTAILSYTQAAQRMLAGREPQILEILQFISNDDIRAIEVIRRLRSLLKKSEPEILPLDMNLLIRDTLALMATDAAIRNTLLVTELDANLPQISGDRIQLQQVLLNLISNSFDAVEDCETNRRLTIRTALKDNGFIIVTVKDTGCGIPAGNLPKLFSRFFTSKPDGLGMGLSISRSIIETHGGHLDGENNPERGASFSFSLPISKKVPR